MTTDIEVARLRSLISQIETLLAEPGQQAAVNPDGTPGHVAAGELIESAWGNAVVDEIDRRGYVAAGYFAGNVGPYTWDTVVTAIDPALQVDLPAWPGGRWLLIHGFVGAVSADTLNTFLDVSIDASVDGGPWNVIGSQRVSVTGTLIVGSPGGLVATYTAPAAASLRYRLSAVKVSPPGAFVTFGGSASMPMFILVQDLGPSTAAALRPVEDSDDG